MANSVDPIQTAPIGAVCSGPRLFASILNLSVMLGNYLQQTASADDIFRCSLFLGALRVKTFLKGDAFSPIFLHTTPTNWPGSSPADCSDNVLIIFSIRKQGRLWSGSSYRSCLVWVRSVCKSVKGISMRVRVNVVSHWLRESIS